jgi:hypothetical protein
MSEPPPDLFATTLHFNDACVAIGVAVLERFAEDDTVTVVTVKRDGNGGWWIGDDA